MGSSGFALGPDEADAAAQAQPLHLDLELVRCRNEAADAAELRDGELHDVKLHDAELDAAIDGAMDPPPQALRMHRDGTRFDDAALSNDGEEEGAAGFAAAHETGQLLRDGAKGVERSRASEISRKKHMSKLLRHNWLRLNKDGGVSTVATGKYSLTHHLGVQIRDLRLLDAAPATSPPALLCRDKAIVANLEFLKCIITTEFVLILESGEDRVTAFVAEVQRRIRDAQGEGDEGGKGGEAEERGRQKKMSFELRVLETVLDFVSLYLEFLLSDLEAAAYPAMDAIAEKVTPGRLDTVRTVKSRMVRLTTRVETIREVLEKLLDDDDDMKDMNLTAKVRNAERLHAWRTSMAGAGGPPQLSRASLTSMRSPPMRDGSRHSATAFAAFFPPDYGTSDEDDKDEVEDLLEAYFMNLDNTYNKLQTLAEYIDDTEDYLKINIDTRRNEFIEYRLMIIIATFCASLVANIANLLAMNLGSVGDVAGGLGWRQSFTNWLVTGVVSTTGSVLAFIAIMYYCHVRKILCY